jgi:hypothetical protein
LHILFVAAALMQRVDKLRMLVVKPVFNPKSNAVATVFYSWRELDLDLIPLRRHLKSKESAAYLNQRIDCRPRKRQLPSGRKAK